MCCIIYRQKGTKLIKKDNLEKVIRKNPHGWGVCYIENGEVKEYKSLKMEDAFNTVRKLEEADIEFLFHVRWATKGEKSLQNCHPYKYSNGFLFHNGTMEKIEMWKKEMSDSWHFTFYLDKQLRKYRQPLKESLDALSDKIGESRLAIMEKDGSVHLYGKWHEIDGCLYSKKDWMIEYVYNNNNYHYTRGKQSYYDNWDEFINYDKHIENKNDDFDIDSMSVTQVFDLVKSKPREMAEFLYNKLSELK